MSTDLYGMAALDACEQITERLKPVVAELPADAPFSSVVQVRYQHARSSSCSNLDLGCIAAAAAVGRVQGKPSHVIISMQFLACATSNALHTPHDIYPITHPVVLGVFAVT